MIHYFVVKESERRDLQRLLAQIASVDRLPVWICCVLTGQGRREALWNYQV
jgi:hypothetical protein